MAYSKIVLDGTVLMDVTQKTVTAETMVSGATALKNDGTGITGNIPTKTSSDLTASGLTVTVPAGYYASQATKDVATGTATTPATTITANPSISVSSSGLITATTSASQSVTPTVSAGYVSSGTAGTITVSGSNTSQLTTQAAQTITPTTTNQTIASGKYLTGVQTILGDANLLAENIKNGVTIFGVTGTYTGGVTTISFTIGGTPYQADSGMTWAEWVASEYNPSSPMLKYSVSGYNIIHNFSGAYVKYNSTKVLKTETIIENATYSTGM